MTVYTLIHLKKTKENFMKKKILCLALVLLVGLALWSCGDDPVTECTEHIDTVKDLKCDVCGKDVPCTEHEDKDKDLKCDYCKTDVECAHIDENNDGICDVEACKWNYDHTHTYDVIWSHDATHHWYVPTCTHDIEVKDKGEHKDENNDGICDVCAWNYDHEHEFEEAWQSDADGHWHNAACTHNVTSQKSAHDDRNEDGICYFCGYVICSHTFDTESWAKDEDGHWHPATCKHTAVKGEVFPHDLDEEGFCKDCGYDTHHIHTYEDTWSYNSGFHWYASTCGHPSKQDSKGEHKDENKDGKCEICEYQFCTHTFADTYTKDENGHWYAATCGCEVKKDEAAHYDNDGDSLGVCDACGYQVCQHTYEDDWSEDYDENYHWKDATCGHDVKYKEPHRDVDGNLICDECENPYEDPNAEEPEIDPDDVIITPPHIITPPNPTPTP